MTTLHDHLFNKRLLFVLGKGGVGKSTVAAALAILAAQQGKNTLLAELDTEENIHPLFGLPRRGRAVKSEDYPSISALNIEGKAALEEYLRMTLKSYPLKELIFRSKIYNYFVKAAPGLKELMAIGKLWYEEQLREGDSDRPLWDIIIVDTPATGHALQYISMPRAAYDTFSTGLVHREAKKVLDLLTDPQKTLVNIVTTPEEMPINETLEVAQRLTKKTGLALGYIFVNKVYTPLWQDEQPASPSLALDQQRDGLLEAVRHWANVRMQRWEQSRYYITRLESRLGGPCIRVPYLFSPDISLSELLTISREIAGQLLNYVLAGEGV